MAALGVRRFDELVGRTDLLEADPRSTWSATLDRSARRSCTPSRAAELARRCARPPDRRLDDALDHELIADAAAGARARRAACGSSARITQRRPHRRRDAVRRGRAAPRRRTGCPTARSTCTFTGSAGQSFGAWLARGRARSRCAATRTTTSARGCRAACCDRTAAPTRAIDAEDNVMVGNARAVRRDGGRGVLPRPGGRAVRRPQLGGARGRRGGRRPRLRVHDRRRRGRARADRAQLRGRHERRRRPTCSTPTGRFAVALQPELVDLEDARRGRRQRPARRC